MNTEQDALGFLKKELQRKEKRDIWSFEEYLEFIRQNPCRALRNIFQMFYDMVTSHIEKQEDEYAKDPESIGFVRYDCSKLFVEGADNPFFADTPFANRFVRQTETLRQGFQQNRMYVYDGPSGSGKSTFLNNLLRAFEAYTNTEEGRAFELVWEIDEEVLLDEGRTEEAGEKLFVPCPSHDYPILIVPRDYRPHFLEILLSQHPDIKEQIFQDKEYEWLFRREACTICKSIFWSLFEKLGSLERVLEMVKVRAYRFDRRVGEGISIFNPGDKPFWGTVNGRPSGGYFSNKQLQDSLDRLFGIGSVRYMFSPLAKTNNGIYALMDVKSHNEERLRELHNVISEGVHKVGDIEENIHSLFFALMNPEDKSVIENEKMKSFQGRVQYNSISYVLEPMTEANIYRNIFGQSIEERFLPRVLESFARVIISSRMNTDCPSLKEWISDLCKYNLYCDENGRLLRMEIYSNNIPTWLSEEDRKNFTAEMRRAVIAEAQNEGRGEGFAQNPIPFSGRDSIALFGDFFSRYGTGENLVNMGNLLKFFKKDIGRERRNKHIPQDFLNSLMDSYDYTVLNEVKQALYFYHKDQISHDILKYLSVVSYDVGDIVRCKHTGEEIEVTADFFKFMASRISGEEMEEEEASDFARRIQKKYVTEVTSKQADVIETDLYRDLFAAYVRNLKERALEPFVANKNFREAIKTFGQKKFNAFDSRLQEHVSHMITNLVQTFGYSEQGAKEICLYVIDQKLAEKFS